MALNIVEAESQSANAGAMNSTLIDQLENASADLCVCDVMILAVDNFVDEIRSYASPNDGVRPDEYVFRPALHAMTMLDQARDQLQEAKNKINGTVDALVKARSRRGDEA